MMHSLPQAMRNNILLSTSFSPSLSHTFLKSCLQILCSVSFPFLFFLFFFCARQVFSLTFRVLRIALSRFNLLTMHKALCGGRRRHRRRSRRCQRGLRDALPQLVKFAVARGVVLGERALRGHIYQNLRLYVNSPPLDRDGEHYPENTSAKWVSLFSRK